jgi:hypothetical protein
LRRRIHKKEKEISVGMLQRNKETIKKKRNQK